MEDSDDDWKVDNCFVQHSGRAVILGAKNLIKFDNLLKSPPERINIMHTHKGSASLFRKLGIRRLGKLPF